jgi:D-3-phosphoglycerate dehydrogenase
MIKTVLATTTSFAKGVPARLERLKGPGLRVVLNPWARKLSEGELSQLLHEHRPVGLLAGLEPITRQVLEEARDFLKVVSRVGAGWDNVDLEAAAESGILVYRTPGVLTQAVAELTVGLMLSALRSITLHDRLVRQGGWQKYMGGLLATKTVGIIGFGAIGQRVGELVRAFGARVLYYDPLSKDAAWAQAVPLSTLLAEADIISLHASGKGQILGPKELGSLCKRGAVLINTARGGLVDEAALHDCLSRGHLSYACLDVFQEEPYTGPLCHLDNVVLTCHVGSYADEARQQMEEEAVDHLLQGLREAKVL